MKQMMKQVVFELPRWARAAVAAALTGVPEGKIRELVIMGEVRARKLGEEKNCATVYRIDDLHEWIERQPNAADSWAIPAEVRPKPQPRAIVQVAGMTGAALSDRRGVM